jgi:hypothetical protein
MRIIMRAVLPIRINGAFFMTMINLFFTFVKKYSFHLQGPRWGKYVTPKRWYLSASHNPEDQHRHLHRRENLRSGIGR